MADDLTPLWKEYWEAHKEGARAEELATKREKAAREQLVSRLCSCFRRGEDWETRASWCLKRMVGRCPFYVAAKRTEPSG